MRSPHSKFAGLIVAACLVLSLAGCRTMQVNGFKDLLTASNDRDWRPELATVPYVEVDNRQLSIHNIRNCNYVTEDDFVVNYYDRQILLDQIQTVDFVVVPFNNAPKLAHTMLSFGLDDGSYLALSVEVRTEKDEKYNPVLGVGKKFEIIYLLSDERDVIRLRTKHRSSEVFVYPTVATPAQAQSLLMDVVQRVNKLAVEPEFYNSITNNCTTNLAAHVNRLSPEKITYGWKVLLPGLSAKYAYDLGLLDNRIPFEDLTEIARVNDLAEKYFDEPQFSQLIRGDRQRIDRIIAHQDRLAPVLDGRGSQLLQAQQKLPTRR